MEKKKVEVDLQLLQELIDYLQQKPHHEVYILIQKIIKETKE